MSFFLLGQGRDGELRLLSTLPAATRKDALAQLSQITSDPEFSDWDSEVYVVDLDQATPVLLVRPGGQTAAPLEPPEDTTESLVTEDEVLHEAPSEVTETDELQDVDEGEAPEDLFAEELSEPDVIAEPEAGKAEGADEEVDEALVAVVEGLAAEDAPVAGEAPDDVDLSEVTSGEFEEQSAPTLREALARTAAQMEASGIVAPESVGPAEIEEAPSAEAEESESPDIEAGAEPVEQTDQAGDAAAPWPWADASPAAEKPAFSLDALEEPGVDEGSLVRAAGDDDTMAAARPVILGAYEDRAAEGGETPGEAEVELTAEAATESLPEPIAETPEEAEAPAEQVADVGSEAVTEPETDFILDLENIAADAPDAPAGYQATESHVRDMTCNDCVYVETCPNKDQRDPATCGSFQWK